MTLPRGSLFNPEITRQSELQVWRRFAIEFWWFGIKEARACVFAGGFFVILALTSKISLPGLARYDAILLLTLMLQAYLISTRIETLDEVKVISVFHVVGFALEVFKTHPAIASWSYPGPGVAKLLGVPLYSGFMYAAVASYIMQAWRLLSLRVDRLPPVWACWMLAILIYANFFTHHAIGDYRWLLIGATVVLFARTTVHFTPYDRERAMPLVLSFVLIGFFIWVAENLATFLGAWAYPHQRNGWQIVHSSKWSSWSLLVIFSFVIVAELKLVKGSLHGRRSGG